MAHSRPSRVSERRLRLFGKGVVAPLFSIGSGVISTVAFSGLSFIAGLSLPWLIVILGSIFLAETVVSYYIFKDSVPDTLADLFVNNIFTGLSRLKKSFVGFSLFCAVGGGFAIGALTYTSGTVAMGAAFGLISISIPGLNIAIAAILAVFGFIAITSLFTRWLSAAIKNNIHLQIKNYFLKLFTRDPKKTKTQQGLEVFFRLLFVATIITLTILGTIATLGTMQKGLHAFLSLIPAADQLAVTISSSVIAYGLMGLARLPFAMQSVSIVFDRIGEWVGEKCYQFGAFIVRQCTQCCYPNRLKPEPEPVPAPHRERTTFSTKMRTTAKALALFIHGVSFGALAKSGGGVVLSDTFRAFDFPLSEADIQVAGQVGSMASGGAMSAGIAAYTFFFKLPPRTQEPAQDLSKREHKI